MNAMGHDVRTFIGVNMNKTPSAQEDRPGYMPMGGSGMGEMGSMEMPTDTHDDDRLRQFGPLEMGGMFTVVKVRPGLAANDYKDPGWYSTRKGQSPMSGLARSSPKPHAGRRPTVTSRPPSSAQSTGASVESGPPANMTIH